MPRVNSKTYLQRASEEFRWAAAILNVAQQRIRLADRVVNLELLRQEAETSILGTEAPLEMTSIADALNFTLASVDEVRKAERHRRRGERLMRKYHRALERETQ